jgi:hypothetical protein
LLHFPALCKDCLDEDIILADHLIELMGGVTEGFDRQVGKVTDERAPFVKSPGDIPDHDQVNVTSFMQFTADIGTKDDDPGDRIVFPDPISKYPQFLL